MIAPPHPGEILKEEYLVPLDMSANRLANSIGLTGARVNEIVRGKRGVTADTALRRASMSCAWLSSRPERGSSGP